MLDNTRAENGNLRKELASVEDNNKELLDKVEQLRQNNQELSASIAANDQTEKSNLLLFSSLLFSSLLFSSLFSSHLFG